MKKISKKMISLLLGFVVLFTTIINPSQFVAKAGETEGYKIVYSPQQMTEASVNYPFMYNGTNCATQRYEMVVSEGHTNILSYKPTHDGTIYFGGGTDNILSSWGAMNITVKENSDSSRKIEFCIADNEGNILYPTNKDVITINDGDTHTYNDIAIPVTKDKEINFVFHGVTGTTNSIDFTGYMQFISADGSITYNNAAWRMYPENDPVAQGTEGFYFKYSATYEKKSLNEPEEVPYNKLQFTSQQMTETHGNYLFSYDQGKCGIYQSDLRVSAGYTTIVTYKATANGTVYFSNNTISSWSQMQLTLTGNTTGANKVDFCIADNGGNILYPTDDKVIRLADGEAHIYNDITIAVQKDQEINFVFMGIEGENIPIDFAGYMQFISTDGATAYATSNWRVYPQAETVAQGTDSFYFKYSTDCQKVWVDKSENDGPQDADPYNKLQFTATEMEDTFGTYPFAYEGSNCAIQKSNVLVSKGYANIVSYKPSQDGTVYFGGGNILSPWGTLQITLTGNTDNSRKVEFCITDNDGKILYPTDNTVINLEGGESHIFDNIAISVKKDQEINFVFRGMKGVAGSIDFAGYMQFISADGNTNYATSNWRVYPQSETVVQGTEGFYFKYATDCVKVWDESIAENNPPIDNPPIDNPSVPEKLPGQATIPVAREDGYLPTYKIGFDAAEMTACNLLDRFKWTMPGKEYICMTNPSGEKIVSGGYANIVTWTAPKAGTMRLANGTLMLNNPDVGSALFAITDKEGNVLYPTNSTLFVLNTEQKMKTGIHLAEVQMKAGDELNFVFQGVSGNTLSLNFECEMYFNDGSGEKRYAYGPICPESKNNAQHTDGWSYRYAKTFENKITGYVAPPDNSVPGVATAPVPRADGYMPTYKIKFDAREMTACNILDRFKWTMPEKEYICMTNPSGEKIVSGGYANIVTWTAKKSGELSLKNGTLILHNPDAGSALFAITDKEGNILYPTDGTMVHLDKEQSKKTAVFLSGIKMKANDEINFIFEGISGDTLSINFECELYYKTAAGEEKIAFGPICPTSKATGQHVDGWSYRYAKSFENILTGYVYVDPNGATSYMPDMEGVTVTVSEDDADFITTSMLASADKDATGQSENNKIMKLAKAVKGVNIAVGAIVAVTGIAFVGKGILFAVKKKKERR